MTMAGRRQKGPAQLEHDSVDRTFHTWSAGNPHLAKTLGKPPPLLKPGEGFLTATDRADDQDENAPYHPDYGSVCPIPIREMLDPDDPCIEFYSPWQGGYEPVLKFYAPEVEIERPEVETPEVETEIPEVETEIAKVVITSGLVKTRPRATRELKKLTKLGSNLTDTDGKRKRGRQAATWVELEKTAQPWEQLSSKRHKPKVARPKTKTRK